MIIRIEKPVTGDEYAWKMSTQDRAIDLGVADQHVPPIVKGWAFDSPICYAEIVDIDPKAVLSVDDISFLRKVGDQGWNPKWPT